MRMEGVPATTSTIKKRKAESQDNERLSKRLSLLNLERNGQVLYVPVEQPSTVRPTGPRPPITNAHSQNDDELMQVDDTKHRVFIYNLDDELSDSDTSDDGKIAFLPDIDKHLRESRIPAHVLANSEGELAGNKQMVLYKVPDSLSVPQEMDSVRKAIIETRARVRERQRQKSSAGAQNVQTENVNQGVDARDWYTNIPNFPSANVVSSGNGTVPPNGVLEATIDDPDAMDLG